MPKRKSEDNYEKLYKKIKRLERKLRRRRRSSSSAKETESHDQEHLALNKTVEHNLTELFDGSATLESQILISNPITETATTATANVVAAVPTTSAEGVHTEPANSLACSDNLSHAIPCEVTETADDIPESIILDILGENPTISDLFGAEINKALAVRLEHVGTHGLTKEQRKDIADKYLLPSNCRLVNAPALNAEIKAKISDMNFKRDKSIEMRQKQTATVISCISRVINKLIGNCNIDPEIIKTLMDAERLLCDSQYSDSVVRRNFILSSLKKEMKDQLQSTKPDNLLFGQNLSETIKTAKAICKSGAELKTPVPRPQQINKKLLPQANTSKNLNWKGPFPARKQTSHPRTKGPPVNDRPSSSSKQSQPPPKRSRR